MRAYTWCVFYASWLVCILITLALTATFAVPLGCPSFNVDGYQRYVGEKLSSAQEILCLSSSKTYRIKAAFTQLMFSSLGIILRIHAGMVAVYSFCQFVTSGVSLPFASALLRHPDCTTAGKLLMTGMRNEKSQKARKWLILFMALALPFVADPLSILAPLASTQVIVRMPSMRIPVTSIADAATLSKPPNMAYDENNPSPFWNGTDSLAYFSSLDVKPALGSGLETVSISIPPHTPPRTLGVIPLQNMLANHTSGVPLNTSDFVIEQELLVVDQTCSFLTGNNGPIQVPGLPGTAFKDSWSKWVFQRFSHDHDDGQSHVPATVTQTDASAFAWLVQHNKPLMVYVRDRSSKFRAELDIYALQANVSVQGRETHKIPIHFETEWDKDDRGLTIRTASIMGDGFEPRQGSHLLCKTQFLPIVYNTTIPAGLSFTRQIRNYTLGKLSPSSKALLQQALNLSRTAVEKMNKRGFEPFGSRAFGWEGEYKYAEPQNGVRACTSTLYQAVEDKLGAKSIAAVPSTNLQRNFFSTSDSCIGTEFDLLLKGYLKSLSFIPTSKSNKENFWAWGSPETRAKVNKHWCILLVTLLSVVVLMLVVLLLLVGVHSPSVHRVLPVVPYGTQGPDAADQSQATPCPVSGGSGCKQKCCDRYGGMCCDDAVDEKHLGWAGGDENDMVVAGGAFLHLVYDEEKRRYSVVKGMKGMRMGQLSVRLSLQ